MTKSMTYAGLAAAGLAVGSLGLGAIALTVAGYAQTAQTAQTPQGGRVVTGTTTPAPAQSRPAAGRAQAAPVKAEVPAAPQATTQAAAPGVPDGAFQTLQQLQKAGVKRCLGMAEAVGRANMTGSNQYAAVSTWNSKQPDQRFSVSMIGQQFQGGPNAIPNACPNACPEESRPR